jgi:hypothetical protein
MRDWASGGGAKIERAKEHVAEFEVASRAFLDTHQYLAVGKFDPKEGLVQFYVESDHVIPPRLAMIAADAIHDLRVPLDVLWHQVWSGGKSGYRKQYFPFVENANELKTRFRTIKQATHKTAVDIVRTANFYKSRHQLLRVFDDMDARDKHEVPILAAGSYKRVVIKPPADVVFQGNRGIQIIADIAGGYILLEKGAAVGPAIGIETESHGPIMDMEGDLTADIAFGKGEILEGEPVLKTLHELTELVEGVTDAFLAAGLIR